MSDDRGWASPGWQPPGSTPGGEPPAPPPPGPAPGYAAWGTAGGWDPHPLGPEVKPGIVPLRPLALGEILDGAISLVRRHARVTLGLSAAVAVVQQLLGLVLTLSLVGTASFTAGPELGGDAGDPLAPLAGLLGIGGISVQLVNAVLGLLLTGLITVVTADAVLGRTPTISSVWARARPLLLPLLLAGIMAGILPFLGLVLLVIPGVFLWGALSLTTPALVLERCGPWGALKRSWRLSVPDWWRVTFIRVLAVGIGAAISGVIVIPVTLLATLLAGATSSSDSTATVVLVAVSTVAAVIASTITAPFTAGVVALLYLDRRMRAEGLDVTMQQTVAADAAAAPSPT